MGSEDAPAALSAARMPAKKIKCTPVGLESDSCKQRDGVLAGIEVLEIH